jgi:hypothetical protein
MIPSGASSFSIGRASGWKRPGAKLPVSGLMILPSSNASFFSSDLYLLSIELIEAYKGGAASLHQSGRAHAQRARREHATGRTVAGEEYQQFVGAAVGRRARVNSTKQPTLPEARAQIISVLAAHSRPDRYAALLSRCRTSAAAT